MHPRPLDERVWFWNIKYNICWQIVIVLKTLWHDRTKLVRLWLGTNKQEQDIVYVLNHWYRAIALVESSDIAEAMMKFLLFWKTYNKGKPTEQH